MKRKKKKQKEKEIIPEFQAPAEDREKFFDCIAEYNQKSRRIINSQLEFHELLSLRAEWDEKFGKEYEKLTRKIHNPEDLTNFIIKAKPAWMVLQKAHGFKVCKSPMCMRKIPEDERKEYCDSTCKRKKNDNDYRTKNKVSRALAVRNSHAREVLRAADLRDKLIEKIIKEAKKTHKGT